MTELTPVKGWYDNGDDKRRWRWSLIKLCRMGHWHCQWHNNYNLNLVLHKNINWISCMKFYLSCNRTPATDCCSTTGGNWLGWISPTRRPNQHNVVTFKLLSPPSPNVSCSSPSIIMLSGQSKFTSLEKISRDNMETHRENDSKFHVEAVLVRRVTCP